MSMYLDFEPHSWYMGFAIQLDATEAHTTNKWWAYADNGNTYRIAKLAAPTLADLKQQIRDYWRRDGGKHMPARLTRFLEAKNGNARLGN